MSTKRKKIDYSIDASEKRRLRASAAARRAASRKAQKKQDKLGRQMHNAAIKRAADAVDAAARARFTAWYYAYGDGSRGGPSYSTPSYGADEPAIDSERVKALRVLGLSLASDNADDVRAAHRRLVLRYHPDKNTEETREVSVEMFRRVQTAYEYLTKGATSSGEV